MIQGFGSDIDPNAVGWGAIDAALKAVYGDQQPRHWAAAPLLS